jgi:hypothetical protein
MAKPTRYVSLKFSNWRARVISIALNQIASLDRKKNYARVGRGHFLCAIAAAAPDAEILGARSISSRNSHVPFKHENWSGLTFQL